MIDPDRPATPGEAAMADTALELAIASRLAAEGPAGAGLTWHGLHALAALGAMLDTVADGLIEDGYGNALLANLADVPSRAFAVIVLLDGRPELAARYLAAGPVPVACQACDDAHEAEGHAR